VLIRSATHDDLSAILHIERASDSAAHWSPGAYEGLFADNALRRVALVATDNSDVRVIHGFVIARPLDDEWEIENLAVAPDQRQLGVGSELLRELLRMLHQEGARAALLEVRESNVAARRLYEKYGFRPEGRRPGYYQNPAEDALLLRQELQLCDNIP
jgi:ribosomal-protein-alanine N-acetyltransferase